jgi:polyhydroxyalkanoate synthesis regulator phasin
MSASRSNRARKKRSSSDRTSSSSRTSRTTDGRTSSKAATRSSHASLTRDGLTGLVEQRVNRVVKPLGLVLLTRERIQETLDDAAERGRLTRSDANDLAAELVRRGRQQTEDVLADLERLLGRGREQFDRARRTVGVGSSFPIAGYDELTASQVQSRLGSLTPAQLRRVREYELRHANRKSVLSAVESSLNRA